MRLRLIRGSNPGSLASAVTLATIRPTLIIILLVVHIGRKSHLFCDFLLDFSEISITDFFFVFKLCFYNF